MRFLAENKRNKTVSRERKKEKKKEKARSKESLENIQLRARTKELTEDKWSKCDQVK